MHERERELDGIRESVLEMENDLLRVLIVKLCEASAVEDLVGERTRDNDPLGVGVKEAEGDDVKSPEFEKENVGV